MSETDWLALLPQYATVAALLFTAYVWWASNRDKKLEALKKFVGELNYLDINKRNLDVLSEEHRKEKVRNFQRICGDAAKGIGEALRDGGANISYSLATEAMDLDAALFSLSRLYVDTDENSLRKLNELWKERQQEINGFKRHVYAEIESHKFRKFLWNLPRNLLKKA